MLTRFQIVWAALTWPIERFYKMVELTYAGEFDEEGQQYEDLGEPTTREVGMVLVSYVASDDGTVLCVHRPFKEADHADSN